MRRWTQCCQTSGMTLRDRPYALSPVDHATGKPDANAIGYSGVCTIMKIKFNR
jgi:hypothetical protein